jgi:DNA modification methylase
MDGDKADMVFTDPPYGVDYDGVNNDHLKAEKLREFITEALQIVFDNCREGSNAYVWHPDIHAYEFIGAFRDAGFIQAKPSIIQWVKDTLVLSQGDYHSRNEPCLYGWKSGKNRQRVEDRTQDTIWEYPKPKKADGHPTMKPIELCARAIKNSSKKGESVIDTFLGSGSTLIACEQTDRTCYGMELSEQYVDVIRKRYAKFTAPDNQLPENWEELTPAVKEQRNG